jgi:hypothetical protein
MLIAIYGFGVDSDNLRDLAIAEVLVSSLRKSSEKISGSFQTRRIRLRCDASVSKSLSLRVISRRV